MIEVLRVVFSVVGFLGLGVVVTLAAWALKSALLTAIELRFRR